MAFPAVSTGIHRWPVGDAARIAITAVRKAAPAVVEEVRFVLFSSAAYAVFEAALRDIG